MGVLFALPGERMYGGWDRVEDTDVERTASSLIRLPLPAPDDTEDPDLDMPTLPRLVCLAAGTGPVSVIRPTPEPLTPRWAVVSVGVLATIAAVLAAALVLG